MHARTHKYRTLNPLFTYQLWMLKLPNWCAESKMSQPTKPTKIYLLFIVSIEWTVIFIPITNCNPCIHLHFLAKFKQNERFYFLFQIRKKKIRPVSREFAFHSFVLYVFVLFFSLLFRSLSSLVDVSLKIWYHTSLYQSVNPFVHADLWRICLFFSIFLHYLFCHASTWWKHVVYNNDQFFFVHLASFLCLFAMMVWVASFYFGCFIDACAGAFFVCFAGENKWWNLERMNDDDDDDMRYAEF